MTSATYTLGGLALLALILSFIKPLGLQAKRPAALFVMASIAANVAIKPVLVAFDLYYIDEFLVTHSVLLMLTLLALTVLQFKYDLFDAAAFKCLLLASCVFALANQVALLDPVVMAFSLGEKSFTLTLGGVENSAGIMRAGMALQALSLFILKGWGYGKRSRLRRAGNYLHNNNGFCFRGSDTLGRFSERGLRR